MQIKKIIVLTIFTVLTFNITNAAHVSTGNKKLFESELFKKELAQSVAHREWFKGLPIDITDPVKILNTIIKDVQKQVKNKNYIADIAEMSNEQLKREFLWNVSYDWEEAHLRLVNEFTDNLNMSKLSLQQKIALDQMAQIIKEIQAVYFGILQMNQSFQKNQSSK